MPHDDDQCKSRWVRVSVEMLEHPILSRETYDRRSAWLWLIANAAWKSHRTNNNGKVITLERGQVLIGRDHLAETWGWTPKMVRIFLGQLASENMLILGQSKGRFSNVATICNYEKYQSVNDESRPVERPIKGQLTHEKGPHSTRDTNNITNYRPTVTPRETRAEDDRPLAPQDPNLIECKQAFNGSTETLLETVEEALQPYGDRERAAKWLVGLLNASGKDAVLQAFQMLQTKQVKNEPVSDVLRYLGSTASGLKAKADKPKAPSFYDKVAERISRQSRGVVYDC